MEKYNFLFLISFFVTHLVMACCHQKKVPLASGTQQQLYLIGEISTCLLQKSLILASSHKITCCFCTLSSKQNTVFYIIQPCGCQAQKSFSLFCLLLLLTKKPNIFAMKDLTFGCILRELCNLSPVSWIQNLSSHWTMKAA